MRQALTISTWAIASALAIVAAGSPADECVPRPSAKTAATATHTGLAAAVVKLQSQVSTLQGQVVWQASLISTLQSTLGVVQGTPRLRWVLT
jgi:hypothetical protein